MAEQKRSLSQSEADRCEQAKEDACTCRCGGLLHGANRAGWAAEGAIPASWFQSLPGDDPHHLPTDQEKADQRHAATQRRLERQRKATAERQEARAAYERERSAQLAALMEKHPDAPWWF